MVIEIKGLVKTFGPTRALDGLDLVVAPGEVYGFVGPNGAGKTTTIKSLLGLIKPDSGSVRVFGLDCWQSPVEIHKRLAYVPGEVSLWPNLSGGEVIDFFLSLHGEVNYQERDRLIKLFDLDVRKKCRSYSKGNRQKVALIAALAMDVDLYIFDEPTSGLDPLMEQVFHQVVGEKKAQGKTILLSSHILSEVEKLCDKVAIIRQGRIIEDGRLTDLAHLNGLTIKVETEREVDVRNDGVTTLEKNGRRLRLKVDQEHIADVMRSLSEASIISIETSLVTLEDLFMGYYGEKNND